jgi:CheY-like chemotaxis protein
VTKILLIDHNPQIRLMTKKLIETREGWLVTEAIDSYDAIAQVVKLKPNLVVLDFAMPGLNGFQIAEKISAFAPGLPIILYTFYGFDAMNVEAKKHGITEVVDKADLAERLLEKIAKHLNEPKSSSLDLPATTPIPDAKDKEEPPKLT